MNVLLLIAGWFLQILFERAHSTERSAADLEAERDALLAHRQWLWDREDARRAAAKKGKQ